MSKHTLANSVIRRAYLDGMAEGVGRGALGYAEDMAGEYAEANAEPLLDAAPELLAALETAEAIIDGPIADATTGDMMSDTGAYDALVIIRAAIAKAKGGADA